MAVENRAWGYTRIVGAMSNLGHNLSRGTAFQRSKHLLEDLFERASRCYEWLVPTLDVLAECFEPRDALGSHDEYSEDVCS